MSKRSSDVLEAGELKKIRTEADTISASLTTEDSNKTDKANEKVESTIDSTEAVEVPKESSAAPESTDAANDSSVELTEDSTTEKNGFSTLHEDIVAMNALDAKNGRCLRQKCFNYVQKKKQQDPRLLLKGFIASSGNPCGEEKDDTYYFEDGLRKVKPYFFTFDTFCKGK